MKRPILAAAFIAFALPAAQGEAEVYLEPPRLPPSAYWGEEVESEVTIVETEEETIYEYRGCGRL